MTHKKDRLLRLGQVCEIVGFQRTKVYELMAQGQFPQKIKVGKASFWSERQVFDWLSDLIESQTGGAAAE